MRPPVESATRTMLPTLQLFSPLVAEGGGDRTAMPFRKIASGTVVITSTLPKARSPQVYSLYRPCARFDNKSSLIDRSTSESVEVSLVLRDA
jgi:hypothetical protein